MPNIPLEVFFVPIGSPFPQWFSDIQEVTVNKHPEYFIKLSKDSSYNTGKLISQTSITEDEAIFYLATISVSDSPLNGLSITLINSVENTTGGVSSQPAFLGAGENAQARLVNKMQGFKVGVTLPRLYGQNVASQIGFSSDDNIYQPEVSIESSYIISDGTNGNVRKGKIVNPDTITAPYFMRIK